MMVMFVTLDGECTAKPIFKWHKIK